MKRKIIETRKYQTSAGFWHLEIADLRNRKRFTFRVLPRYFTLEDDILKRNIAVSVEGEIHLLKFVSKWQIFPHTGISVQMRCEADCRFAEWSGIPLVLCSIISEYFHPEDLEFVVDGKCFNQIQVWKNFHAVFGPALLEYANSKFTIFRVLENGNLEQLEFSKIDYYYHWTKHDVRFTHVLVTLESIQCSLDGKDLQTAFPHLLITNLGFSASNFSMTVGIGGEACHIFS